MICSYPVQVGLYCLLTFVLGVLAGLSEILPRYRDDPWRAAFCLHGIVYWLINGLVSHCVFFITVAVFWEKLDLLEGGNLVHSEMLKVALGAGVGAMALLRSKLFKITLKNGEEYSVGPDHIINALLVSTNEYIDRYRGQQRTDLVKRKFADLDYNRLKAHARTLIFGARQTLPEKEEDEFGRALAKIESDVVPQSEKALQIGYKMIDYLGESFVRSLEFDAGFKRSSPPPAEEKQSSPAEARAAAGEQTRRQLPIKKLGRPPGDES